MNSISPRIGAIGPAGGYLRFSSSTIGTNGFGTELLRATYLRQLAEKLYFKVTHETTTLVFRIPESIFS